MQETSKPIKFKIKRIQPGDILQGTIIKKKKGEVFVDLSPYGVGRLYGVEYLKAKKILGDFKEGNEVSVKIIGLDDGYGNFEIELQDTKFNNIWNRLKDIFERKESLELEIKEANSGGLIVEIENIKGFVPVSQLSPENYPRVENNDKKHILNHLKSFVGQKMKLRIITLDSNAGKLILSERAAKIEEYQKVLQNFKEGDIIEVRILGLSNFGIFVRANENPPIDGLIHISEIPDYMKNLEENFKKDDFIKAQIIKIEKDRVNLSLRYLLDQIWIDFANKYKTNDNVRGKIIHKDSNILAIAEIIENPKIKGLILENVDDLEIDKEYYFVISELDPKEKKLILKIAN